MKKGKRNIDAPAKTRRSKRLAISKDVSVSPATSSESDNGESNADVTCTSMTHLGSYEDRAVVIERFVAVNQLTEYQIPSIVKKCGLEPICNIKGFANLHLVREFFAGIVRDKVDSANMVLETVVRGKRIVVTPDNLAKILKFKRPQPDEAQYPYNRLLVQRPEWEEIGATLCTEGCAPDEDGNILLRDLDDDFIMLHHIFWWNVHPKPPRREIDMEQAQMLFAVYNGFKPDVPMMWWKTIYTAYCNDHSSASLPLGILLTNLMTHYRIGKSDSDTVDYQKSPLNHATISKSKGQSKLHRKPKTLPLGSVEENADMLCKIMEQQSDMFDLMDSFQKRLIRMEKRQKRMEKRQRRMDKQQRGKCATADTGEKSTDSEKDDEMDEADEADDDGDQDDEEEDEADDDADEADDDGDEDDEDEVDDDDSDD